MTKTTDLDQLNSVNDADLLLVVDVSDTSMSPNGTSKKLTVGELLEGVSASWSDLSQSESIAFGSSILEFDGRFQISNGLTFVKPTGGDVAGPSSYTTPQKETFKQGWQMVFASGGTGEPSNGSIYPDNIMKWGWNCNGEVHNEPRFNFTLESAFRNEIGGVDCFEFNIDVLTQDATSYRCFGLGMPRATFNRTNKDALQAFFAVNYLSLGSAGSTPVSDAAFLFDMRDSTSQPLGKFLSVGAGGDTTAHIRLQSANTPCIKQNNGGGFTNLPYVSTFETNVAIRSDVSFSVQYDANVQCGLAVDSNSAGMVLKSAIARSIYYMVGATTYCQADDINFRDYTDSTSWLQYSRGNFIKIGRAGGYPLELVGGLVKPNLPTSNPGAGFLWNDGGTVKVGT